MFAGRRSFGKPAIPPKMMTMDFAQYVFGNRILAGCAGVS